MTIEYLHFDSFNQVYSTSNQFNTYTITAGSSTAGPNSFNTDFHYHSQNIKLKRYIYDLLKFH